MTHIHSPLRNLAAPPNTTPYVDQSTGFVAKEWQDWYEAHRRYTTDAFGSMVVNTITTDSELNSSQQVIIASGNITLTLPDPPSFFAESLSHTFYVKNSGSGVVTLDSGSVLVDGLSSRAVVPGGSRLVVTDGENWFTFMLDPGGSVMGLPFDGVLGNGSDGALTISANTTATEEIPIYQLTTLNVQSGFTWTAYNTKPGGFICSVQGRCTIAGTIEASGRGGRGGDAQPAGAGANGRNGFAGFHFGGTGGAGGGATGTQYGSQGAPCRAGSPIGGWQVGNIANAAADTTWAGDPTLAAAKTDIRNSSGQYVLGGGSNSGTGAGGAGNAFATGQASANMPDLFSLIWSLFRTLALGWGSGAGSGGTTGGSASGAGGAGGGCIIILCDELDFTGTINANGVDGSAGAGADAGGGGGGGGGCVIIGYRTLVANTGTINVAGGAAGAGGGGTGNAGGAGGAGFSKVFAMRI